jgi:hypothetical protein
MKVFLVNSRNQSTIRNLEKLKLKYEPIKENQGNAEMKEM